MASKMKRSISSKSIFTAFLSNAYTTSLERIAVSSLCWWHISTVRIFVNSKAAMDQARYEVESLTGEVEIGKIYKGVVKTVKEFGAFVEIMPGQEGMVHISELANYRVKNVEDICKVGDEITVKVVDIDDRGRVRLSRKAALADL